MLERRVFNYLLLWKFEGWCILAISSRRLVWARMAVGYFHHPRLRPTQRASIVQLNTELRHKTQSITPICVSSWLESTCAGWVAIADCAPRHDVYTVARLSQDFMQTRILTLFFFFPSPQPNLKPVILFPSCCSFNFCSRSLSHTLLQSVL